MGSFINFPEQIQVTLGSAWKASAQAPYTLEEGDVLVLKKLSETSDQIEYSEDGTDSYNLSTNRILMTFSVSSMGSSNAVSVSIYLTPGSSIGTFLTMSPTTSFSNYTFRNIFENNTSFSIAESGVGNIFFDTSTGARPYQQVFSTLEPFGTGNGDRIIYGTTTLRKHLRLRWLGYK